MNEQAHCGINIAGAGAGWPRRYAKTPAMRSVSGIEIDCSGLGSGWKRYRKLAKEECKAEGYKVVARSDDT